MDDHRFTAPITRKELRNGRYKLSNRFCGWVVEPDVGWAARFRRWARDYARLAETLPGLHFRAFSCLMRHTFTDWMSSS